ncbi:glycosyltransferase [Stenomitos frigidus]|uniref:Glycosyltransferase family 1 protein n=1 Tax=Stenomitos frigidus ULC18 TaxID=2107698 RepID=A0A2T1ECK1_9CYAN|nr:glycosyltransferase [Stenomitos frigidus]PSB30425.1 glycosyltransferase family 1 protein [Stenomitos frigidus ULC18]
MKALVIGNAKFNTSDLISPAQLYPFFGFRQQLKRDLGLTFHHENASTFAEIEQVIQTFGNGIDAFFIRPAWDESPIEAERVISKLRATHPTSKIIFIDPWDQVASSFFNLLPYVDRLLKYQRLKDISQYQNGLLGGTAITDYLARELGYDLQGWQIGSEIPPGYADRIETGWNVTLLERFQKPLFGTVLSRLRMPSKRDIDVFCRVSYGVKGSNDWYGLYRKAAIDVLQPLENQYNLAVSGEYVGARVISSRQYFREIKRTRIAFCPFGWGETTWRDYEAVCYGCLLVKPSMDHMDTQPNIYIPHETYVPVRWDFSDLEETCRYYLEHPEEADRIIQNARRVYQNYFKQGTFVKTIGQLLQVETLSLAA